MRPRVRRMQSLRLSTAGASSAPLLWVVERCTHTPGHPCPTPAQFSLSACTVLHPQCRFASNTRLRQTRTPYPGPYALSSFNLTKSLFDLIDDASDYCDKCT